MKPGDVLSTECKKHPVGYYDNPDGKWCIPFEVTSDSIPIPSTPFEYRLKIAMCNGQDLSEVAKHVVGLVNHYRQADSLSDLLLVNIIIQTNCNEISDGNGNFNSKFNEPDLSQQALVMYEKALGVIAANQPFFRSITFVGNTTPFKTEDCESEGCLWDGVNESFENFTNKGFYDQLVSTGQWVSSGHTHIKAVNLGANGATRMHPSAAWKKFN
jgi:hypothetical protein